MDDGNITIPGGRFFSQEGELMLAIGSRDFAQKDIEILASIKSLSGILFYFVIFHKADFSILKNSEIKKLSFLHGNFSNEHLWQLENFSALSSVKLLDTKVTTNAINEFKRKFPLITLT